MGATSETKKTKESGTSLGHCISKKEFDAHPSSPGEVRFVRDEFSPEPGRLLRTLTVVPSEWRVGFDLYEKVAGIPFPPYSALVNQALLDDAKNLYWRNVRSPPYPVGCHPSALLLWIIPLTDPVFPSDRAEDILMFVEKLLAVAAHQHSKEYGERSRHIVELGQYQCRLIHEAYAREATDVTGLTWDPRSEADRRRLHEMNCEYAFGIARVLEERVLDLLDMFSDGEVTVSWRKGMVSRREFFSPNDVSDGERKMIEGILGAKMKGRKKLLQTDEPHSEAEQIRDEIDARFDLGGREREDGEDFGAGADTEGPPRPLGMLTAEQAVIQLRHLKKYWKCALEMAERGDSEEEDGEEEEK